MWQFTPFIFPSVIATILSLCLAWFGWKRRDAAGAKAYVALNLSLIVWALTQILSISALPLEIKIFFSKIQYLGIVATPVFWLIFALTYTGHGRLLYRLLLWLLGVIPLITLILVFTNETHGLIWFHIGLNRKAPFTALSIQHGAWFLVHLVYSYFVVLIGTVLLIITLARSQYSLKELLAVIAAPLIVVFSNALYLSSWNPSPYLDITPLGFAVSDGIMGWVLLRLGLLDIVPIARSAVIDGMGDAVIALNQQMEIVDINPIAATLFEKTQKQLLGRPFRDVANGSLATLVDDNSIDEIIVRRGDKERIYEIKVSQLKDGSNVSVGRLIVLRDITRRKETEQSLLKIQRELQQANTELSRLAGTDSLTGAANHRAFTERIKQETARSRRGGQPFGLIILDIDFFKQINDKHGHPVGDRVLIAVADKIKNIVREIDLAARIGGEEFAIISINDNMEGLKYLTERLREQIANESHENDKDETFQITVSMGVSCFEDDTTESLIRRADEALYKAKRDGRNRIEALTKSVDT